MNDSRYAYKVGLFIVVGAALLALLILNFSKGNTLGKSTYTLRIVMPNAAGLKPTANVMMAGVPIGKVTALSLADNTKSVDITVDILSRFKIQKNAEFRIDSLGFIGDQYVAVSVPETKLVETSEIEYLRNGDTVLGKATFNMQEAVQSISGVVDDARKAIKDLDQAITNVNASVLSKDTLGHLVHAVSNLEVVSSRAVGAVDRAEELLHTNEAPIHAAIKNFEAMSATLTNSAAGLDQIINTNAGGVHVIVTNLVASSDNVREITQGLRDGKGSIGGLLKDDEVKLQIQSVLNNTSNLTAELAIFAHNLNQRGIWSMLWKPKHKDTNSEPERYFRR